MGNNKEILGTSIKKNLEEAQLQLYKNIAEVEYELDIYDQECLLKVQEICKNPQKKIEGFRKIV